MQTLRYDERFGEIKLEITESMIEVSTLPQQTVTGIASDLGGLRETLVAHCKHNNIALAGGGTHAFHHWPERRLCPGERFDAIYQRYGYLAKQFTVFGQHIHVGVSNADDAIWLTQALGEYVPAFIALSASSPFIDGEDTLFQSARLNAVSAFPLSGQCPPLENWAAFISHFRLLQDCGIAQSIRDLCWDIRPKPEYGTVEIRVCDTPLDRASHGARHIGAVALPIPRGSARLSMPKVFAMSPATTSFRRAGSASTGSVRIPRRGVNGRYVSISRELLDRLQEDATALGCESWLARLFPATSDADWLRTNWLQPATFMMRSVLLQNY